MWVSGYRIAGRGIGQVAIFQQQHDSRYSACSEPAPRGNSDRSPWRSAFAVSGVPSRGVFGKAAGVPKELVMATSTHHLRVCTMRITVWVLVHSAVFRSRKREFLARASKLRTYLSSVFIVSKSLHQVRLQSLAESLKIAPLIIVIIAQLNWCFRPITSLEFSDEPQLWSIQLYSPFQSYEYIQVQYWVPVIHLLVCL